jgi:asparagine synthase (glutamine-hydrolysing)
MCGIAGILSFEPPEPALLRRMTDAIEHRGPDDEGVWVDRDNGVGLGHRRLSIVDLSPSGHQPMLSPDGRLVLNYNGEIYNHLALRAEIEAGGAVPEGGWRGHSDTEVLLAAISAWGLEVALSKAVGMFALALWDASSRTLTLARDRFGEKPLYYGWAGKTFLFGSELKALRLHPDFDNPVSRRALGLFASRAYVPAPFSIFEHVYKLPPGCILHVTRDACAAPRNEPPEEGADGEGLRLRRYWSYRDVVRRGLADPIADEREALEQLEQTLASAIKDQSVADVPVGAFLSGGVDSSTIVALYQHHSNIPVRTFTIGFDEAGYDEADHARAVAEHLETVHDEYRVTVREAMDAIPLLPTMYDEPFADSSQIPTYLVSRFARRQVTVALTGDGGDELFGGYVRHFAAPRMWRRAQRIPVPLRSAAGATLGRIPSRFWNSAGQVFPGQIQPHFGEKVQKTAQVLGAARNFDDVYRSFLDEWSGDGRSPVRGNDGLLPFDLDVGTPAPEALRVMYCDVVSYLPDDILCKVDRASMAVSLETRVPFLDHRVAELAARIPLGFKLRDGRGKHVIRELLYRHVPRKLIERPKTGFAVPVAQWIKGPLRGWAEDLLDSRRMAEEGWFDAGIVHRRWQDHLSGRRSSPQALWAILMFQSWLRAEKGSVAVAA